MTKLLIMCLRLYKTHRYFFFYDSLGSILFEALDQKSRSSFNFLMSKPKSRLARGNFLKWYEKETRGTGFKKEPNLFWDPVLNYYSSMSYQQTYSTQVRLFTGYNNETHVAKPVSIYGHNHIRVCE